MIITLIGYRGTGKSTLAYPLAERLGWSAVDADDELERRTGKTIRDIFAADGEPGFRRIEREVLVDLLQRDRLVLAAGGGAILDENTRAAFRQAGPVVWLRATARTIAERLAGDTTTAERRPNLTTAGGLHEIEELLEFREPLYRECASLTVDTDRPLPGTDRSGVPTTDALVEFLVDRLTPRLDSVVSPETQP